MNNSIYAKLFATYLALTALGTFLLGGYLMWSFYIFFLKTKQVDLEDWTNALSKDMQTALICERFIQTAQAETIRLSRLIKNLLDLGRLEAGVPVTSYQLPFIREQRHLLLGGKPSYSAGLTAMAWEQRTGNSKESKTYHLSPITSLLLLQLLNSCNF